ncbi:MAG: hypothetical protein Q4F72_02820 [Desulfovibrionaceae bacterium]|nr:hypothetical protein [Desulfovibrionaceae bacterium]
MDMNRCSDGGRGRMRGAARKGRRWFVRLESKYMELLRIAARGGSASAWLAEMIRELIRNGQVAI